MLLFDTFTIRGGCVNDKTQAQIVQEKNKIGKAQIAQRLKKNK